MQSPRTDPPSQSHLTFLHPGLEVPRYNTVSRASKDHHPLSLSLRVKWQAQEMSLGHSQRMRNAIPHKLTIIRTPLKDTRPKLSATGQKSGLKMTAVHRSTKL